MSVAEYFDIKKRISILYDEVFDRNQKLSPKKLKRTEKDPGFGDQRKQGKAIVN